eukprot:4620746-Alexandrium_andersonii.AAC.1
MLVSSATNGTRRYLVRPSGIPERVSARLFRTSGKLNRARACTFWRSWRPPTVAAGPFPHGST